MSGSFAWISAPAVRSISSIDAILDTWKSSENHKPRWLCLMCVGAKFSRLINSIGHTEVCLLTKKRRGGEYPCASFTRVQGEFPPLDSVVLCSCPRVALFFCKTTTGRRSPPSVSRKKKNGLWWHQSAAQFQSSLCFMCLSSWICCPVIIFLGYREKKRGGNDFELERRPRYSEYLTSQKSGKIRQIFRLEVKMTTYRLTANRFYGNYFAASLPPEKKLSISEGAFCLHSWWWVHETNCLKPESLNSNSFPLSSFPVAAKGKIVVTN